jgi:hypothetical protein
MPARSGGGINSKQTSHYTDAKKEPVVHPVSPGAVSRLGGMVGEGTPHKNLYSSKASTPYGATPNNDCRVGGNGRVIMRAGSQAPCKPARPLPHGKPEF